MAENVKDIEFDEEEKKIVAKNLSLLRKDLGLTQKQFAEKIGLTDGMISKYEKGDRSMKKRTFDQICNVFNVNVEWFKTGKGVMYNIIDDLEISELMGKVFAEGDDFLKQVFLTFAKLSTSEREVLKKVIRELNQK